MSYLIDTNVLSELKKRQPHPGVARWFAERPAGSLYLSVLTLGELRKGIEAMPESQRKRSFLDWLENEVPAYFSGRIFLIDTRRRLLGQALRRGGKAIARHRQPARRHRFQPWTDPGHPQRGRFQPAAAQVNQSLG